MIGTVSVIIRDVINTPIQTLHKKLNVLVEIHGKIFQLYLLVEPLGNIVQVSLPLNVTEKSFRVSLRVHLIFLRIFWMGVLLTGYYVNTTIKVHNKVCCITSCTNFGQPHNLCMTLSGLFEDIFEILSISAICRHQKSKVHQHLTKLQAKM